MGFKDAFTKLFTENDFAELHAAYNAKPAPVSPKPWRDPAVFGTIPSERAGELRPKTAFFGETCPRCGRRTPSSIGKTRDTYTHATQQRANERGRYDRARAKYDKARAKGKKPGPAPVRLHQPPVYTPAEIALPFPQQDYFGEPAWYARWRQVRLYELYYCLRCHAIYSGRTGVWAPSGEWIAAFLDPSKALDVASDT